MKILVTVPLTEEERIELQSKMPDADYVFTERDKATEEEIREADIILGNVVPDKLAGASNLKWLQLNTAGADQYVKEGVLPAQTILTNAAGCYELSVSEHMLASTFYLVKKLGLYHRNQMDSLWKCENLLLTPHVAGGYHMQETLRRIIRLFIDNLGRYAAGEELRGVVRR